MGKFKFYIKDRVKFYETDLQGIMHHSHYLRYFETARVEYMRNLDLVKNNDFIGESTVAVVNAECSYLSPLKFDDEFKIFVRIIDIKNASMTFEYNINKQNDNTLIATGFTKIASVSKDQFKPTKLPEVMKNKILAFEKLNA